MNVNVHAPLSKIHATSEILFEWFVSEKAQGLDTCGSECIFWQVCWTSPTKQTLWKKVKKTWFLLVKIAPLKKLATYFKSEDICEIFQQMFLLWPNKYVTERKLDTPLWKVILSRIHFPKNHASRYVQHFQVKIAYCRGIMWQVTNCIIS